MHVSRFCVMSAIALASSNCSGSPIGESYQAAQGQRRAKWLSRAPSFAPGHIILTLPCIEQKGQNPPVKYWELIADKLSSTRVLQPAPSSPAPSKTPAPGGACQLNPSTQRIVKDGCGNFSPDECRNWVYSSEATIEGQMHPLFGLRQLSVPDYSPVDVRTIDSNLHTRRLGI